LTIVLAGNVGMRRRLLRNIRNERRTCIICGTEEVGTLTTGFLRRFLFRNAVWRFEKLKRDAARAFSDPEWYLETCSIVRNFSFPPMSSFSMRSLTKCIFLAERGRSRRRLFELRHSHFHAKSASLGSTSPKWDCLFPAAMISSSQAILMETFPPEEQQMAMRSEHGFSKCLPRCSPGGPVHFDEFSGRRDPNPRKALLARVSCRYRQNPSIKAATNRVRRNCSKSLILLEILN
jgi:hypothetical protein